MPAHGETVPIIGDFNAEEDQIELRYEDDGSGLPPVLSLDQDDEPRACVPTS